MAAFINAIAEEGTKAEAVEWLQKTWDENCELRAEIERLTAMVQMMCSKCRHRATLKDTKP